MELNDKSMYDIVCENFLRRNRRMFIHRLVYLFEYENQFDEENGNKDEGVKHRMSEMVEEHNKNNATLTNDESDESVEDNDDGEYEVEEEDDGGEEDDQDRKDGEESKVKEKGGISISDVMIPEKMYYRDENVSGILFMYNQRVGIHVIEGSDAMIMNHLESLFKNELQWTENLKNVKLLYSLNHIYKRIVPKWLLMNVTPPMPTQPIEVPETDEDHCALYETCLTMLANVQKYFLQGANSPGKKQRRSTRCSYSGKLNKLLPPEDLLRHLLTGPLLEDLKVYSYRLTVIPKPIPYHEMIWPLPTDHVPDYHDILLQKGETLLEFTNRMKKLQS